MPAKRPASSNPEHPSPEAELPAATPVSTLRPISNPRPKKAAKPAPEPDEHAAMPVTIPPAPAPASPPIAPEAGDDDISEPSSDWPYEAEVAGAPAQEGSKRKRRRRKGKGGQGGAPGPHQPSSAPQAPPSGEAEPQAEFQPDQGQPRHGRVHQHPQPPPRPHPPPQPQQPPPSKVDPELLAEHAWKIFLAEVSEEGIALINDGDARDLTRRCFRLAEIFLEQQQRRG